MFKNKRRRTKRKAIRIFALLLVLVSLVSIYYYSRFVAPTAYEITTKTITSNNLSDTINDLKIAFISDINLKDEKDIHRLKKVVQSINKEAFDMVVFGGDLYSETPFNNTEVISILKSINSNCGKFAVQGEKDLLYSNDVISILSDGGFEVLHHEYRKIHYQDTSFALFGLESNGDISGLLNDENHDMFKLVVVHEPDYFDVAKTQNIDLQLSGHSMGGYINLPILGPLYTKTNAKNYVHGTYKNDISTLLISNGLGLEKDYNYRLFTANEVLSISLTGTKKIKVEETPKNEETQPTQEETTE